MAFLFDNPPLHKRQLTCIKDQLKDESSRSLKIANVRRGQRATAKLDPGSTYSACSAVRTASSRRSLRGQSGLPLPKGEGRGEGERTLRTETASPYPSLVAAVPCYASAVLIRAGILGRKRKF